MQWLNLKSCKHSPIQLLVYCMILGMLLGMLLKVTSMPTVFLSEGFILIRCETYKLSIGEGAVGSAGAFTW